MRKKIRITLDIPSMTVRTDKTAFPSRLMEPQHLAATTFVICCKESEKSLATKTLLQYAVSETRQEVDRAMAAFTSVLQMHKSGLFNLD